MNKSEAFIYVSAASYLGAAAVTVAGFPPMAGISALAQGVSYIAAAILLSYYIDTPVYGTLLAAIYGVLAMLSFSGVQQWINYNGASDYLGVAMALWDLALAVAILTVEER